jgi:deoxycytidylate deaminase
MSKAVDLSHIYQLRNNFTVIGLTGRTGSGCSEVAKQLVKGFDNGKDFELPFSFVKGSSGFNHNSYRKYRIIYEYAKINFQPYSIIKYKDVLTLFLLEQGFDEFVRFLSSEDLKSEFVTGKFVIEPDFNDEIKQLSQLKPEFDMLSEEYRKIEIDKLKERNNWLELYSFFFEGSFKQFSDKVYRILKTKSWLKRNKTLQIIANNLRKSGHPYLSENSFPKKIDTIVELINDLIKSHRKKIQQGRTQIVIDSLRNPFEIMFFKQRYAAFYTIAIHREDLARRDSVIGKNTLDNANYNQDIFERLLKEEYNGGKDFEFYKQKVEACIQQADIHLNFLKSEDAARKNEEREKTNDKNLHKKDNTTPYFSWRMQLLKYVSLVSHPGLVPPSPEERCMQLAYTAKHNSGCISRHVGAAVTDETYSVKAIGWNNTPEGLVPCVLRNAGDLLNPSKDIDAFTPEERSSKFQKVVADKYAKQIELNGDNLKGCSVCFCFKSLKNSIEDGKNQVHTRSLHAEENAFLQITKNGGSGIKGGKLFTTASPCELCAKKAYQLGIEVIYYIDPYPGISNSHILTAGSNPIEVRLFNGAIGNAYHWLYDPVMAYKDEQTLLLGLEINDRASELQVIVEKQDREIDRLNAVIKQMNENRDMLEAE